MDDGEYHEPLEPPLSELTTASVRLTRDLREAAELLEAEEARFLVDMFETKQRDRIRNGNRLKALEKSGEPHRLLSHFQDIDRVMEGQIAAAFGKFCENDHLGQWMLAQKGVGPLVTARLLAFIDWEGSSTPSRIWAFAGLVPGLVWEKGAKRPWNARLKRLCWLLGESFVKNKGRDAFYADLFFDKKKALWAHNISGGNRERALVLMDRFGKTTEAHRWYRGDVIQETARMVANGTWPKEKKPWATEQGAGMPMLPPAHVHAMARRWVVKLFLAHAWEVAQRGKPGFDAATFSPYVIAHGTGHSHKIEPPPG
jgi:hypothetical protein